MWLWYLTSIAFVVIALLLLSRYVRTVPLAEPWLQTADGRIEDAFLRSNKHDKGLGVLTAEILKSWTRLNYEAVIVSAQGLDGQTQYLAIEFIGPSKVRFTGKPLIEIEFAPPTRNLSLATAFLRSCDEIQALKCSIGIFTKLASHLRAFSDAGKQHRRIDAVTGLPCISGYLAPNGSIWRDKFMTFLQKGLV
uniref:Uncharacterized protein n=1 Tax=Leptocylindrus danicus TaxID=163516 RepID=A0A7S2KRI6_9STRA|mmetsp:Transcript_25803/g.38584  ORF Transcript_25803/g.38584 Transcript_25803/m.38584 type:complete len:193 (+) Transcript_25803:271-849(+)|eukprot:CAMPEP_0116019792 /NCGR_PEP_ID=MMETSP0321-20121206/9436_1 /TAXON_ID=163516 /ORGANISM="Leptocylindrus danicus var. danicus, Strain B650" /LENGTH=192 /DNA_ID=CAMNT_0003490407 /DNA_START=204 /DNA_END=782 /DNA_ORIENTATION=+